MNVLMSGAVSNVQLQDLSNITKRTIMDAQHQLVKKMQKVVNVLALASAAVSLAVVIGGATVYVQREAIIKGVTDKVLGGFSGGLGGGIAPGATDLKLPADSANSFELPAGERALGTSSPF